MNSDGASGAIPRTYDELYRSYHRLVRAISRRQGVHPNEIEDVAQEILLRFFQRGLLEEFDPRYGLGDEEPDRSPDDVARRFRRYVAELTRRYAQKHYQRGVRHRQREVLLCDGVVRAGDTYEVPWLESAELGRTTGWLELAAMAELGRHGWEQEERELHEYVHAYLAKLPRRAQGPKRPVCNEAEVFDRLWDYWLNGADAPPRADLAADFGISTTAVGNWTQRMRAGARAALGELDASRYPTLTVYCRRYEN